MLLWALLVEAVMLYIMDHKKTTKLADQIASLVK